MPEEKSGRLSIFYSVDPFQRSNEWVTNELTVHIGIMLEKAGRLRSTHQNKVCMNCVISAVSEILVYYSHLQPSDIGRYINLKGDVVGRPMY